MPLNNVNSRTEVECNSLLSERKASHKSGSVDNLEPRRLFAISREDFSQVINKNTSNLAAHNLTHHK